MKRRPRAVLSISAVGTALCVAALVALWPHRTRTQLTSSPTGLVLVTSTNVLGEHCTLLDEGIPAPYRCGLGLARPSDEGDFDVVALPDRDAQTCLYDRRTRRDVACLDHVVIVWQRVDAERVVVVEREAHDIRVRWIGRHGGAQHSERADTFQGSDYILTRSDASTIHVLRIGASRLEPVVDVSRSARPLLTNASLSWTPAPGQLAFVNHGAVRMGPSE